MLENKDTELSSLDNLFQRSIHFKDSNNYISALNFIVNLRNVAPFNAWLLREQNPDITAVASAEIWERVHNRKIKTGARAYVILKPFAPVAFVYDVKDTVGEDLPADTQIFFKAEGILPIEFVNSTLKCCMKKGISVVYDRTLTERQAGWASHHKLNNHQEIVINDIHSPEVQFSTLCHELAHLMLGHLGIFSNCECKSRSDLSTAVEEVEAESVSWLVCKRLDISTNADSYLSTYFKGDDQEILQKISIDNILTTAGRIESMIFNHTCRVKKQTK